MATANRCKETTTSTGTGTVNLAGAPTGFQTLVAGIGTGSSCYYTIALGTEWEVGWGTVTSGSPDTLSRLQILGSSNAGSLVSFSAGSKDVFITIAATAIYGNITNPSLDVFIPPSFSSTIERKLTIASGKKVLLGSAAILRVH